jgi:hypothetical protein
MIKKVLIVCLGAVFAVSVLSARAEDKKKASVDISKLPPASDQKGVKAKLRLDTIEGALKGSENGKVIEPGKSADSVLVHNVAHLGNEDDFMPPPDNKAKIPPLTKDQIGLIRAWIDQGAK